MTAVEPTLDLPEAILLGPLSALCGLSGDVRLVLIDTAQTTTSSAALGMCLSYTMAIPLPASLRPATECASGEIHREPLEIGER